MASGTRTPRGERQLERRRLECQRQLSHESEQVERRQPGVL